MKRLFDFADSYVATCRWMDISLIKLCVGAIGFIAGLFVPREKRRVPLVLATLLFAATYIPLMGRFIGWACSGPSLPPEKEAAEEA